MSGGDYPPPQPEQTEYTKYIGLIRALYHIELFKDCPAERTIWSRVITEIKKRWP